MPSELCANNVPWSATFCYPRNATYLGSEYEIKLFAHAKALSTTFCELIDCYHNFVTRVSTAEILKLKILEVDSLIEPNR